MFSQKSIQKVLAMLKQTEKKYSKLETEKIKICISKRNRKIGRVLNVSLPPVLTCANCKECKNYCYDIKACLQHPKTVIDARIRNYILMKYNPEKYFNDIRKACKGRRKNKFFRWHVAGDIPSMEYFKSMILIAKEFPDFIFWTYTKKLFACESVLRRIRKGIHSRQPFYHVFRMERNAHRKPAQFSGIPLRFP